ncbi:uncharacterized protein LOC143224678 [Tachypleus tridentatus]|uniref:uncharacterized protein LOC143224678 n=1 Tax=Tachypleus tridentatus TaxID=6853 RepID=UPI003FD1AEAA
MIGLTYDLMVYTWGEGKKGQLGHGFLEPWLCKPKCVEALKDKNITKVCAGEGFSVFSSSNGIVMTCGDGSQGCLGYGGWNSSSKPKLVEKLLSVDVLSVTCGPHHVVVVSGRGVAYAWGCGSLGRLGTGSEDNCSVPMKVHLPENTTAVNAFCGSDGTMFVTDVGALLACGSNLYNKLGLAERRMFLVQVKQLMVKNEIYKWLIPTRVNFIRNKVVSVSMGPTHTVVLLEQGKIITFGNNQYGQLGHGHIQNSLTPKIVKLMADKYIVRIQCGSTFTVATTTNTVYFWGGRQIISNTAMYKNLERHCKEDPIIDSLQTFNPASHYDEVLSVDDNETSETSVSEVIKIGQSNTPLLQEVERIGPDASILHVKTPESRYFVASDSTEQNQNAQKILLDKENVILHPCEILALYVSQAQVARGEIVSLSGMYCSGNELYVVLDTTLPLPESTKKKRNAKQEQRERTNNTYSFRNISAKISDKNHHAVLEISSDTLQLTPKWLKKELEGPVIPDVAHNSQEKIERNKPVNLIEDHGEKAWRNNLSASERNSSASLYPSTSLIGGFLGEDTDSAPCINNKWTKLTSQTNPASGMTTLRSSRIPINVTYFNSGHRFCRSPQPLRGCNLAYSKRCSTNPSDNNILGHYILPNTLCTVVRSNNETSAYNCTRTAIVPGRIGHIPVLYCWRCLVQELPVSCPQCKRVFPTKTQLGRHPSEIILKKEKTQLALSTKQTEEKIQELGKEFSQQLSQLEKWAEGEDSVKIEVSELKDELRKQKLLLRENQDQINKFQDQLKILEFQQNLPKKESSPVSNSLSQSCKSSKICSIL